MSKIKSSISFVKPIFVPAEVPKHPQSMFNPRSKLIMIAIKNTINREDNIAEFSFTDIPNISSKPETSSIHGKVMAKKFIKRFGKSLKFAIDCAKSEGLAIFSIPA